ncbi:uncharacterized protein LOC132560194 [Ylistrum balloti]|uniref:uncharacterized protein LOC132560194 n=1 Tax=Ylistrum balloti TaxID=509963 RepID=UPI0029059714|nr:uncharacterized protein LOC132560194 [Ylistrum balloti]
MTIMSFHANMLTSSSCRLLATFGSSQAHQLFRNTRQRCLSTLRYKSQCQISAVFGLVRASQIASRGLNNFILQNAYAPIFCISTKTFSTGRNRHGNSTSPGEMKRELQSGMYGENFRGRMFDIRNTSKLVTSFSRLPVFELKRMWLLHILPSYYLGKVDRSFSAGQFMGGADMAVEPILESAGSGNYEELYEFMDEQTIEEMQLNRKNINSELLNMLTEEVIFDMSFQNERTLCSFEIQQLETKGLSKISITGILRGDAMITTPMGQTLYRITSPSFINKPHEIPMDINIHFMFRCTRDYYYDDPHKDWVINGFTFLIDVPDLFIAYIL